MVSTTFVASSIIATASGMSNYTAWQGHKRAWQSHNRGVGNFNEGCGILGVNDTKGPTLESVDWEKFMNPVRDQGYCGSCHTFATIAALEGASSIAGNPVSLSEEQLVDCMDTFYDQADWERIRPEDDDHPKLHVAGGCAGGDAQFDLMHFMKGGLQSQGGGPGWCACTRESYPYLYSDKPHENGEKYREPEQQCKEQASCHCGLEADAVENCIVVAKVNGIFESQKEALKNALSKQPVAVSVYAHLLAPVDAWGKPGQPGHNEDVIMPDELSGNCNATSHAVTAVGFGVDADGTEYFKIRNSWGNNWGNGGYFKVNANGNGDNGPLCMYTDFGVYPKLASHPSPTPKPTPTPSPTPVPTPTPIPAACKYIDPRYTMCCEHAGIAVVCAKGQTCGVLAGLPTCLLGEEVIV